MANRKRVRPVLLGLLMVIAAGVTPDAAQAGLITDPANDFVPSFQGPPNADLDVLAAEVLLTPTNFVLHAVLNGPVGTTAGGFYVWGFNRGAGTQGFPIIAPGVLFDRVVVLNSNGTGNVPGFGALPAGSVTISGNQITGIVPLAALPSTGFAPENYTWNLWPRSPVIPGDAQANVSDFAPDNSNASVTPVPVLATALLFAQGGLMLAGVVRFRRRSADGVVTG